MKELNLEYETDINGSYIGLKLNSESELDKISYLVMQQDCPDFVVPFKKSVSNGQVLLKFQMNANWTALKYSLNKGVTKSQFIDMMLSIIEPLLEGADWFLRATNFAIDLETIYVDRSNNLFFIYVPIKEEIVSAQEIMNFVKQFSNSIEIIDDPKFQVACMKLFNDANVNLATINSFLNEEKARTKPVANNIATHSEPKRPEVGVTTPLSLIEPAKPDYVQEKPMAKASIDKQPEVSVPQVESSNKEADIQQLDARAMLLGNTKADKKKKQLKEDKVKPQKPQKEKKGFGLFGKKKDAVAEVSKADNEVNKSIAMPEPSVVPVAPSVPVAPEIPVARKVEADIQSNDTFIFEDAVMDAAAYLQLVASPLDGAPERIALDFDKPFVTVGRVSKDSPTPDIAFPSEFKGIGRKHAIIEREGNVYYLIDQGSSNKTLINGEQLIPNKKYMLNNNDEISFTIMMPVKYRVHLG